MINNCDYLVVGAGLFGSVFARVMTDAGYSILVIDKRNHIGGNCYTENIDGIDVHKYGAHIFHTSDKRVWDFVNTYTEFNDYKHRVLALAKGKIYSLPINLMTFSRLWNANTPDMARIQLSKQKMDVSNVGNMEEWCIANIGFELYGLFIRGYTMKQWGLDPSELPVSLIKRLPLRFDFNDNYFNDIYQGVPKYGYTKMFKNLLKGIMLLTDCSYSGMNLEFTKAVNHKVLYTGMIDEYFKYRFGNLEYRSLSFDRMSLDIESYQGTSVMNYCDIDIKPTRVIEHKYFNPERLKEVKGHTIVSVETPKDYEDGDIPYYPMIDKRNKNLYIKYRELAKTRSNMLFGGRLAEYKYYDMHQIVAGAIKMANNEININKEK